MFLCALINTRAQLAALERFVIFPSGISDIFQVPYLQCASLILKNLAEIGEPEIRIFHGMISTTTNYVFQPLHFGH